uniref:Uncharacterized protein n=1 Tax=Palpitomonas bilix TaxID=652834 RepID=A0A7S3LX63_9EUKA|mmetsp:Transcript_7977/g.20822  ORF Transcript_7977/g.20822 Transcript_7977/m.20822 type:complete len:142 (+) Transcript_7977:106-531(+)
MTKEGKDGAKPELEISSLPGPGTYVPKQNAKGGGYLGDAPQSTLHGGVAGRGPLQANSDLRGRIRVQLLLLWITPPTAPFYTYSSIADGSGGVPAPGAYGSEVSVGKQTVGDALGFCVSPSHEPEEFKKKECAVFLVRRAK